MTDDAGLPALPTGWTWSTLEEIRLDRGQSRDPRRTPEETFELYSVPSFDGRAPEICKGGEIGSSKRTVEPGTVLLCKINPRINRVWIVGEYSPWPKIASTEWIPFFPQDGVDAKYLSYFMQQSAFRDYLASHVSGVGGSLMRVRPAVLSSCALPLCPLTEQHRIADKIDELFTQLDSGVEALQRVKAQLRRYRQAVLKAAFEGKLTEEWREAQQGLGAASPLLDQMRARERVSHEHGDADGAARPRLPHGWGWVRARSICGFITKGTTPKADRLFPDRGDVPYIKVYNLTFDGRLDFSVKPTFVSRDTHTGQLARSKVVPGDVLMNIVGPPLGKVAIVPATYPEWNINQAIARFRARPGVNNKFLAYYLLSDLAVHWAVGRAKATAGQFNLTLEICRNLPVPVCSMREQERIVEEIEAHLSIGEQVEGVVEASLKRAERLRQSILKRAFEGRLVPQDPADEPAAVLLERIRAERGGSTNVTKGRERREGGGRRRPRCECEGKQGKLS